MEHRSKFGVKSTRIWKEKAKRKEEILKASFCFKQNCPKDCFKLSRKMEWKQLQRERDFKKQLKKEEIWISKNDNWLDESGDEEDGGDPEEDKLDFEPDPHYNDKADDKDADWVSKNLESNFSLISTKCSEYLEGSSTDAVLNCPCCFTLITLHCQQHEHHQNQYRSMFVRNCKILKEKEFRYKKRSATKSKKKTKHSKTQEQDLDPKKSKQEQQTEQKMNTEGEISDFEYIDRIYVEDEWQYESEIYAPVVCSFCSTEIGVFEDDVYHFFNCVPSS